MITYTIEGNPPTVIKEGSKWRGSDNRAEFTILAVWNPNEEHDPWVRYRNQDDSEFTCRLEAFLARFSPMP
jgi:hypothetical protein